MPAVEQASGVVPFTAQAAWARTGASALLGAVVSLTGVLNFAGWAADIEYFRALYPGFVPTIPWTANGLFIAGLALYLIGRPAPAPRSRQFAWFLSALVIATGIIFTLERAGIADFGIDLLLFGDKVGQYPYLPAGRMATNTAVSFLLAGAALVMLCAERFTRAREVLATLGFAGAAVALLGHVYGAESLYSVDRFTGMAQLTAICFALLFGGIFVARPTQGAAALIAGRGVASALVRRLATAALLVPTVAGAVWLRAYDAGAFSPQGGIALLTVIVVSALIALVLHSGVIVERAGAEREALLHREQVMRAEAERLREVADDARDAAETASRVKSGFLATMSHELRTPLTAIIGYTSLMRDGVGGELSGTHDRHAERVAMSARHLLGLIDEVLTVARLDAGRETVHPRDVTVAEIVDDTVAMAEPLVSARGLEFIVDAPVARELRTDPDRVRQILLNLLTNATKFTARGTIALHVAETNGHIVFEVRDTGMGIAPEHIERIFEPFWQVDMNTTRRVDGAGLGLNVSSRLAGLLGGRITVVSTPGEGSTFRLELPA